MAMVVTISTVSLRTETTALLRELDGFMKRVGIYLLAVILASGGAFIFQNLISFDDWYAYTDNAGWQGIGPVSMGRPVFSLISQIAAHGFALHPFDTVLLYAALCIFAFTVFHRWSESAWVRLLVVSLFVTNPLLVEHLHFSTSQIPLSVALILLTIWFVTILSLERQAEIPILILGSLAAAIAVATRNELVFLMSGAGLTALARAMLQDGAALRQRAPLVLGSIALACILAVAIILAALPIAGVSLVKDGFYGTSSLIGSADDFMSVLRRFAIYWQIFLWGPHHLFPLAVKILIWIIAIAALLQSALARDFRRFLVITFVGILLSAVPLSLGLATVSFPYFYAGVFPLALYPCFLASAALTGPVRPAGSRAAAAVACGLVILVSAANLSAAQVRLGNLNRMEFSMMTQFLGQIRATEVPDWKLAIYGKLTTGAKGDWSKGDGWAWSREMCSVFECQRSLPELLRLLLLEKNSYARVFMLTDAEKEALRPKVDALDPGSASLLRLDRQRFVIVVR